MLNFLQYLLSEAKIKPISTNNPADSAGKIHEILVGKHLNNGSHPEDYRVEGKKPEDILHAHAKSLFGQKYAKHPEFKKMDRAAKESADEIRKHLKKHHGINTIGRVAWTSQAKDHHSETGVHDPLSKADLIVSGTHPSGDHTKAKKVSISLKYKHKRENKSESKTGYSNPGMKTLSAHSGNTEGIENENSVKAAINSHSNLLKKHGIKANTEEGHEAIKKKSAAVQKEIKDSSKAISRAVADQYHAGLVKTYKGDDEIKKYIKKSVGANGHISGGNEQEGKTHLPTVLAATTTGARNHHKIADAETHVNNYLSHFHNLEFERRGNGDVYVTGTHKGTGEKHSIHRVNIRDKGKAERTSVSANVELSAEGNKSVDTSKHLK